MTNPTLKFAKVTIGYKASDGYRSEAQYGNYGKPDVKPEAVLMEAFGELSRLVCLFGDDMAAERLFALVKNGVAEDLKKFPT